MASAPSHYIVDLLAGWGDVRLKRMFGGMGAYHDDLFFAIIDDDIVYFKVDDTTRGDYEAAGSEPFSFPRTEVDGTVKDMIMNGYWRVPDEVLEDADTLAVWAEKACGVARSKPVKAKKTPASGLAVLGPASVKWLIAAGIASRKDLENLGAVEAYIRVKAQFPKAVSLNLLWGLYALLHGIDVKQVTPDVKEYLMGMLGSS